MAVDNTGHPYKWGGPITLHFDLGPLGSLSKSQADALTESAMHAWTAPAIPGSNIQFIRGTDLTEDHGNGSSSNPALDLNPPYDGITPVIYDQTGLIIDTLGANASDAVVGVGVVVIPDDLSPVPITEGLLIMNGKMIGEGGVNLPMDQFKGAIIHEFGHVIGLGHSQASVAFIETGYELGSILPGFDPQRFPPDYRGMPTMFPAVLPELDSLSNDDIFWMKGLYGDSASAAAGSISGVIKNIDGSVFNGANVVAYDVADPTNMVTCVSGFTDAQPLTAPSGTFRIPALPLGSKWILDVEPIVDSFTSGSSVGPIDPPADLPWLPEFVNENGIESDFDQPSMSTTFAIPDGQSGLDVTGAVLQFNDPLQMVDVVQEIDIGVDEYTAQLVPVTPGRMTVIKGNADPAEPGGQELFVDRYVDFYRVKGPAGLELHQVMISSDGSRLDVGLLDLAANQSSTLFTQTSADVASYYLSLYIDSSRISDETYRGTFSFAVGFAYQLFGEPNPFVVSNYDLTLMFSVSDRDALALAGTDTGTINPDDTTIRIKGRGFKNIGGSPIVSLDNPALSVTNVVYVDDKNLDIQITKNPGYSPGPVTLQVVNRPESGGYGGRIMQQAVGTPSGIVGWELY